MAISRRRLNAKRAEALVHSVLKAAESDSKEAAWLMAAPLLEASGELAETADGMLRLIADGAFERQRALEAAAVLVKERSADARTLGRLGMASEVLCDMRYLNAAPPDEPVLVEIAEGLLRFEQGDLDGDEQERVLRGLGTVARILGRTWDEVTERCEKRLVELAPDDWKLRYNLGLFYKTRGRFAEGLVENQAAFDRGGAEDAAVQWNLGICATGAGDAERALEVWKSLGHRLEIGRFALPDGPYPSAKLRLAEHPLAERDPEVDGDEPGLEESVWIERVSPCHGIIRSALLQDLGVDYGDAVLFDGAPITYHEYQGEQVPVFPHLATLARPGYHIFRFGGTQGHPRQIADLSEYLPADAVLYAHTEQFQILCQACWEGGAAHEHHADEPEHRVVTGKLCCPPDVDPTGLLAIIDQAVAAASGVQLFIPELVEAAGDSKRAEVESRRLEMISANG